ncbi:MAG: tRNA (adenosine(37)-N6)-threonylcarbamoyltransferase complex transferase subunit TsaD [bacterium]|nr:tRNA (adenosine(37)-N6)-threonylcarbamoyltransferase complex transferase subunit TsaD [bacterium]
MKTILAIETSCDETSLALLEGSGSLRAPEFKILNHIISSQINIHRPFGGVVPNLAKREHIKNLPILYKRIMNYELGIKGKIKSLIRNSKFIIPKIDYIAVTVGPGLEPALWTGIVFAQKLGEELKKPVIGVNHMEGHLYASLLSGNAPTFPAIALIVSGGHTMLLHMKSLTEWKLLGETLDDAAGEAFDKVAKMLKLPYPGGPEIQKIAEHGNPKLIAFPRPMLREPGYEFSFSGLKTSVLYYIRDNPKTKKEDVAASFQQAVIDVLVKKTIRAAEEYNAQTILLCGGVAANKPLRENLKIESEKLKVKFVAPEFQFNTDNAAMIGAAAYMTLMNKKAKKLPLVANGGLII